MTIGERIKVTRKVKSLTQEELAKKTSISLMSIRRYESGDRMPPIHALSKIADALEVPVEQLLGINSPTTHFMDFMMQEVNLNVQLQ